MSTYLLSYCPSNKPDFHSSSTLISSKLHSLISLHLICTCPTSKSHSFLFLSFLGIIISFFIRLMQSMSALDSIFLQLFFFWLLASLAVKFLRFVPPANPLSPTSLISQFFIHISVFSHVSTKTFKLKSPVVQYSHMRCTFSILILLPSNSWYDWWFLAPPLSCAPPFLTLRNLKFYTCKSHLFFLKDLLCLLFPPWLMSPLSPPLPSYLYECPLLSLRPLSSLIWNIYSHVTRIPVFSFLL